MNGRLIRVAVILTAVLVFAGVGTTHSQTKASVTAVSSSKVTTADAAKDQGLADPSQADFTTDLRPIISNMKFREGTNFVTETSEGLRVYAVVQITEIQVKDASGNDLKELKQKPKRTGRNPQTGSARMQVAAPGGGAGDDDPRCWHCYDKGGQTHCFEIKCPFLAAPGTGTGE